MRLSSITLASLTLAVVFVAAGQSAFGQEASTSTLVDRVLVDPTAHLPRDEYGNCPDPQWVCDYYHQGTAVLNNYCGYADCFDMTYLGEARLVAADDEGLFPRTFKVKHSADSIVDAGWAVYPCQFDTKEKGDKTTITIPEGFAICGAGLETTSAYYYWHFASYPLSGCLGMVECKLAK